MSEPQRLILDERRKTVTFEGSTISLNADPAAFIVLKRLERERLSPQGGGYQWDRRPCAEAVIWNALEAELEKEKLRSRWQRKFRFQADRIADVSHVVHDLETSLFKLDLPKPWRIVGRLLTEHRGTKSNYRSDERAKPNRLDVRFMLIAPNETPKFY